MDGTIATAAAHHIKLTVTNVARSRDFYTGLLGFQVAAVVEPTTVLSNGTVLLGLSAAPDSSQAIPGDRFDENRVGLDHLSLSVADRPALDRAARILDERGIVHGDIIDLAPLGMSILAFRDPDNIQLELTAPIAG